jgi:hypothetical protein
MQVRNGDTSSGDDHEADHQEPARVPPQKPESRGSKDRIMVPAPPAETDDASADTDPSARRPAALVRRGVRATTPVGERRLTVPASQGGVTIVAQKGAVLNVKLEMVVSANRGRGSKDSKLLLGAPVNVEDDMTTGGDDGPTKLPTGTTSPINARKPAKKDRTP